MKKNIYIFYVSSIQKSTIYPNETPPQSLPCNLKPLPLPITASEQEAEHTTPKKTQPSKAQKEAPTTQGAMRAMESRTIKKSKTSREKDKVATMTEPHCTVNGL